MNQRERTLMFAVAGVVALLIAYQGYKSYAASLEKYRGDKLAAEKEEMKLRVEVNQTTKAIQQLARWRDQSLPNDAKNPNSQDLAAHAYDVWLKSTLSKSGVNYQVIQRMPKTTVTIPSISTVGFSVSATPVNLTNIIDFLYNFYSSPILHQITRLDLQKDPTNANLRLTMQIEAMILPGAANTDKLPEGKANAFKLADVAAYRKLIGDRNIFNPFRPPGSIVEPPRPTTETVVDNSQFTKFTGTSMGSDGLIAWIYVTTTGEQKLVKAGDAVNVDTWSTKIVSIEPRAVVIADADGRETRVEAGTMLRAGRDNRPRGGGRGRRTGGGRTEGGRGRGSRGDAAEGASGGERPATQPAAQPVGGGTGAPAETASAEPTGS